MLLITNSQPVCGRERRDGWMGWKGREGGVSDRRTERQGRAARRKQLDQAESEETKQRGATEMHTIDRGWDLGGVWGSESWGCGWWGGYLDIRQKKQETRAL